MSQIQSKIFKLILSFALTISSASVNFAQSTSGTIFGQITDAQGAAVPQATITAKNEASGLTQNTQTNENGDFVLVNLPPAAYTLTVSKDGFATAVSGGNRLFIDQRLRVNLQLAIGEVSATVNVSAESPLLQTQTTETSQIVETKRISDLPLLGRNFLDLTRLSPGVANGQGGNTLNISVNGQRELGNSVIVDGIEVTGNRNNDTGLSPSVDSVQEFKIQTSAYAPEFGRAAGAVISIQTKQGGNEFHGSVYEFFRPSQTAARTFFATERGNLKQNNFGGTIGGPIVKNKLFFFFSYEGVRSNNSFNYLDSVPPLNQIRFLPNGDVDLSGLRDPATGNQIPIFDPVFFNNNYYAQQFAGNIIPANRVSAAGRAVLQRLFPNPTQAGTFNGYYSNFPVSQTYRYDQNKYETKIDYNISSKDRLAFGYHFTPYNYQQGDRFAGSIPFEGGGDADQADRGDAANQSFSIAETHIFSSTLVNEFRFGYNRFRLDQTSLVNDASAASSLGFGNINLSNFAQTNGLPQIQLGTGYITGGSTFKPLAFLDSNFQFINNITKQFKSHNFKAGVDFRILNATPTFSLYPTGYFFFNGAYTYAPNGPLTSDPVYGYYDANAAFPTGGSDIADLLLGYPTYSFVGLQLTDPRTKALERSFYVQDSWQVTRNLVLNYGLRYEFQTPYREKDNNISNFDPVTRTLLLAGRGGNSETLVNSDKNNFMPRLGISYKLDDRTVLRAGYGIFYTPENDARSDILTKNYPFATQSVYTSYFDYGLYNFVLPYSLDAGIPRQTSVTIPSGASSLNALTIPGAANQTFYYVDPNFKTGYSQLYNVVLQRELFSQFTVEAGYVGSTSRKLPYAVGDLNRSINGNKLISNQLGQVQGQFSIGEADYNSLQLKADKRFSQGTSFFGAYTYSKCMDNGPAPFNLGRNNQAPQDPRNLAAERAVCGNDVRHNITGSVIYEIPIGKGRTFLGNANGFADAILGGWQLNAIYTARTGLPVNVIINSVAGTALRPNLIGNPYLENPTLGRYFNTAAFSNAGVTASNPGSAGRNILRGPGYSNLDLSTFKRFNLASIREGMNFEVRFEFFNITNTPHFANPNAVFGGGNFGQVTNTIGNARIIQFAGKFNF